MPFELAGIDMDQCWLTNTTLLHSDVTEVMQKHVSDGSIGLAIAGVRFFLQRLEEPTVTPGNSLEDLSQDPFHVALRVER